MRPINKEKCGINNSMGSLPDINDCQKIVKKECNQKKLLKQGVWILRLVSY